MPWKGSRSPAAASGDPYGLRRARLAAAVVAVLAACLPATPAAGSELIARDARAVELSVGADGRALVSYTRGGVRQHVLAWGAVDALHPRLDRPQVSFRLEYAAGAPPARVRDVCGPYRGPRLAWLVTACTAPDGSHWALQAWQRRLPNYGLPPDAERAAPELRLSHWTGPVAELTVHENWAYRRYDHLFGRLTYRGVPVHGFGSKPSGEPLDTYGRNVYVDTLDSPYGPGWRRENGFLVHRPTGVFCYGFYRHGDRPSGMGRRYRATVIGPGVTPDVTWTGAPLEPYDRSRDLQLHRRQEAFYRGDELCSPV
jgi:hypothetical protein